MRFVGVVLVGVLVLGVSGCSGDDGGESDPYLSDVAEAPSADSVVDSGEVVVATWQSRTAPLLNYDGFDNQAAMDFIYDEVSQIYKRQCLQAGGFELFVETDTSSVTVAELDRLRAAVETYSRDWGPTDTAVTKEFGYNDPNDTLQSLGMQANKEWNKTTPPGYQRAEEKCSTEYDDLVTTAFASDDAFAGQGAVLMGAQEATLNDERFSALKKQWSDCMAEAGYSFSDPAEAKDYAWPAKLGDEEINTALQDVQCKGQVRFMDTKLDIEFEHQETLMRDYQPQLQEINDDMKNRMANAQKIYTEYQNQ